MPAARCEITDVTCRGLRHIRYPLGVRVVWLGALERLLIRKLHSYGPRIIAMTASVVGYILMYYQFSQSKISLHFACALKDTPTGLV